jgi:uncharacterized protein YdhG (YjbR/CyaY superfamily)
MLAFEILEELQEEREEEKKRLEEIRKTTQEHFAP